MLKMVVLVKKRADLSMAAFKDYWVGSHTRLSTKLPGLRGYRINIAMTDQPSDGAAPWDGSAELWFDDRASLEAGLASTEGVVAGEDVGNFADRLEFLWTEEHIVVPGP